MSDGEIIVNEELTGKEAPFTVVGSTVVVGPDVVKLVNRSIGDGLGSKAHDTIVLLRDIALEKSEFEELKNLADKNTPDAEQKNSAANQIEASQYIQDFLSIATINKFGSEAGKNLWLKTVVLAGKPYVICNLGKEQADIFQTGRKVHENKPDSVYRFVDTALPTRVQIGEENTDQAQGGSLDERLAGIVDAARKEAFDDSTLNPNDLNIHYFEEERFPNGRLCVVIGKKVLSG
jgi:hypothetical protein